MRNGFERVVPPTGKVLRRTPKQKALDDLEELFAAKKKILGLTKEMTICGLLDQATEATKEEIFEPTTVTTMVAFRQGNHYRFTQPVRDLVCSYGALGYGQRKIPIALRECFKKLIPGAKDILIPSKTTVLQILKEGRLISRLEALARVHAVFDDPRCLAHDGTTSRGKSLLGLAVQTKEERIFLGVTEHVCHDGKAIAGEIVSMVEDMQGLLKEFPETHNFVSSLSLSSFCGVMGDHTNVNKSVVQELSKELESPLVQFGCHAHKCDLVETYFLKALRNKTKEDCPLSPMLSTLKVSADLVPPQEVCILSSDEEEGDDLLVPDMEPACEPFEGFFIICYFSFFYSKKKTRI